jgi:hypothetical protein
LFDKIKRLICCAGLFPKEPEAAVVFLQIFASREDQERPVEKALTCLGHECDTGVCSFTRRKARIELHAQRRRESDDA